jgi:nicotine blue oxidoreductase
MTACAGLILAAGAGTRLGRPKALVEIAGETLADRAVRTLRQAGCDPVIIVLGARAEAVRAASGLDGAGVVVNDDWATGIASSLRAGLAELAERAAPAAVISVVDQPGVTSEIVQRLIEAWRGGAMAAVASYDGSPGNPVLIDARSWAAVLERSSGDQGARVWLREHPEIVVDVPCGDLDTGADVDTPADAEHLVRGTAGRTDTTHG